MEFIGSGSKSNRMLSRRPKEAKLHETQDPLNAVGPQEIEPGLYLGSMEAASPAILSGLGITHVLTIAREIRPVISDQPDLKYMHVQIEDKSHVEITPFFPLCHEFINDAIESGGKVLVHCIAGKSRSSTVVISYLMMQHQLAFKTAHSRVLKARNVISPNSGFQKQLTKYEELNFKLDERAMLVDVNKMIEYHNFVENEKVAPVDIEALMATQFSCSICELKLFQGPELEHLPEEGKVCNYYHLASVEWVPVEHLCQEEGLMMCPTCTEPIGKYAWAGLKCSCGKWVVPAFRIFKHKTTAVLP